MEEKPKRRWLRYNVRTLLVAVTIFCVWLGWQVNIVWERKSLLESVLKADAQIIQSGSTDAVLTAESRGWTLAGSATRYQTITRNGVIRQALPWFREALGDEAITAIALPQRFRDDEVMQKLASHFPEAMIYSRAPDSLPIPGGADFRKFRDSE